MSLTNATDVSLGGLKISGTGSHGVQMTGGSNLTLSGVQVTNAGNADKDGIADFVNNLAPGAGDLIL